MLLTRKESQESLGIGFLPPVLELACEPQTSFRSSFLSLLALTELTRLSQPMFDMEKKWRVSGV